MTLTGQQYEITAGAHSATIVEVGAGLRGYACGGRDVTVRYPADELSPKGCGAVLVPWPNRIRGGRYSFEGTDYQLALTEPAKGNASHGLGRWERWTALSHEENSVTLALDVVPQTGWPFEVRAEVTYTLDAESGLRVSARAHNTGTRRLPFGIGFHPYIDVSGVPMDDVSVRFAAQQRLVTDDAAIPVDQAAVVGTEYDRSDGRPLGTLRMDDAFTGLARDAGYASVTVTTPGGNGARVWLDGAFEFVQVFTLADLRPGTNGVAVEPMTCPANAFNSGAGLVILEPGAAWSGQWGITPVGSASAQ